MKTTLPPRSEHVAEKLAAITQVIRDLMGKDLALLILFGSYARGDWVWDRYEEDGVIYTYESDFDLLVVSEGRGHDTVDGAERLMRAIERRLERDAPRRPSPAVIVEHIKHVNKDLERGHYFFSDIQKEGVLLFDGGRHTLSEAKPTDPVQNQKYAQEDYEYWFDSASGLYLAYETMFNLPHYNNAAFLLHQVTERFLNAVILTFTRYKPKTHDIEKLDRQASDLHPEFFKVFPRATEEQKRLFKLLKDAYIDARYKRTYKITKEELEYLAARVRKLQDLTKRLCEERIAGMA